MLEGEWLAERFEEHRTRLTKVAHRMLGSPSEAEDAVQEAGFVSAAQTQPPSRTWAVGSPRLSRGCA